LAVVTTIVSSIVGSHLSLWSRISWC